MTRHEPSLVRCPGCGATFHPESCRAIAEGRGLPEDPVLGGGAALRFAPGRFDLEGRPIDPSGASCSRLACPACRAELPRGIVEDALARSTAR